MRSLPWSSGQIRRRSEQHPGHNGSHLAQLPDPVRRVPRQAGLRENGQRGLSARRAAGQIRHHPDAEQHAVCDGSRSVRRHKNHSEFVCTFL